MFKQRTLFGKLFVIYLAIALTVILLIAIVTTQLFRWNSIEQKKYEYLRSISITNAYVNQYAEGDLTYRGLIDRLETKAIERDSLIFIVNEQGRIWFSVSENEDFWGIQDIIVEQMVSQFDTVKSGVSAYSIVKAEGIDEPIIIMGCPIVIGETFTGATYEVAMLEDLKQFFGEMVWNYIFIAMAVFIMAFLLIYIIAKNIQKPIKQIENGVKELAKGNFKARIETKDQTEIGALVGTFNLLGEELEKYDYMRQSFVANVSHELRSPLTSVQGMLQGVVDGTVPEEEKNQYLEIALDETKRMGTLIADLLNLSKIESGQFPLKKTVFDINETALRVLFTFETQINEKELDVEVNMPDEKLLVEADPDRIIQVLTNLIANAVKFSDDMGILEISTIDMGGKVSVSVRNTGEVISEEDMPYIFDRFFKADKAHSRNEKGTGIGLSIVKNILDQHGQSITVTSSKENGTVFAFTLEKGVLELPEK